MRAQLNWHDARAWLNTMSFSKTAQYSDISIEDVKSIDDLKQITEEKAEEIRQDIISLCDVMAAILIEETKNEKHEKKKG